MAQTHGLTLAMFRKEYSDLYSRIELLLGYDKDTRWLFILIMFPDLDRIPRTALKALSAMVLLDRVEQDGRGDMLRIIIALDRPGSNGDLVSTIVKKLGVSEDLRLKYKTGRVDEDLSAYAPQTPKSDGPYKTGITDTHKLNLRWLKNHQAIVYDRLKLAVKKPETTKTIVTYFLGHETSLASELKMRESADLLSALEDSGLGDAIHMVLALRRTEGNGQLVYDLIRVLGLDEQRGYLMSYDCRKLPTKDMTPLAKKSSVE
jgi:hypothetical protein